MSADAMSICLCGKVFWFTQTMLRCGLTRPSGGCRCEGHNGAQLACVWEHIVPFIRNRYGSEIISRSQCCNERSFRRLSWISGLFLRLACSTRKDLLTTIG